jgi:hypothetical protein
MNHAKQEILDFIENIRFIVVQGVPLMPVPPSGLPFGTDFTHLVGKCYPS